MKEALLTVDSYVFCFSKVHKNADIWRLYSQLSLSVKDPSQEDRELVSCDILKPFYCILYR